MRRLIVTADDFGYSHPVNEAVIQAHGRGVLRFASLLVSGEAAEDAVHRAKKECPKLQIGLHLNLCFGRAVLAPEILNGLVNAQGFFSKNPVLCGLRYFFQEDMHRAIEAEMRAQFERFLSFGLPPAHVDGHLNIHVHPVIFPKLSRLAREYGFSRIRIPGGELLPSLSYRGIFWPQMAQAGIFAALKRYLLRCHGDPRLEVPERTWGLLRSGKMSEEYFLWLLDRLPEGTTEIYFHPTSDSGALPKGETPTPTHHTVLELRALMSPRVREKIAERGIQLA